MTGPFFDGSPRAIEKESIVDGTATLIKWWLRNRLKKIREVNYETMAINPFMAPLVMAIHSHTRFEELASFLLGGHFWIGHATGFGKLVDEKILPQVFGTVKLDTQFRRRQPFNKVEFDDIDHIVERADGVYYLSLKAGRWTIQLGQAVGLNRAFANLIDLRNQGVISFEKIIVSTFYGKEADLTDKYRILRGITTGKDHDVADISDDVKVYAGRNFWAWIGHGQQETQDWVMEGILQGIRAMQPELEQATELLERFKLVFTKEFSAFVADDGSIDWHSLLKEING